MGKMNVAVLGSGVVGEVLANGFIKFGYNVIRGSRSPEKLADWKTKQGALATTATFEEAVSKSDLVVLAVKGNAAEAIIKTIGAEKLAGKIILDATNPIADAAPTNGVLKFFTDLNQSLMEKLQLLAPKAHFVKAFSCVGNAFMVSPQFPGGKPTMFICGNNTEAKGKAAEILSQFGWETEDMGMVESARAIEPLCMLWCIPGIAKGQWTHAFKLLKM